MNYFQRIFNFINPATPQNVSEKRSYDLFGAFSGGSNNAITKNNLETISAVHAAFKVLSSTIATLPIQLIKEEGENKIIDKTNSLYFLVHNKPNLFQTPFSFKEWWVRQLLKNGNALFVINWDLRRMEAKELIPVDWSRVKVSKDEGVLYYDIDSGKVVLEQANVLHIKHNSDDGIIGKGIVDFAMESLGHIKNIDIFGSKFFENGTTLTGVLQSEKTLTDKAIEHLRKTWNQKYSGATNSNGVAVLEDGLKFQQISVSPEQAQFLQSRKFSVTEVARWFGLPPDKLGDLERATFSNITQQDLNFVKQSITPLAVNFEEELNSKLISDQDKTTNYFKINMNAILRGDIQTRFQAYKEGILNGFLSPNEVRALEDLNPYEGGDEFWKPLNYTEQNKTEENENEN